MTNEQKGSWGKRIEIVSKGKLRVIKKSDQETLKEDAAPRDGKKKEEVPVRDIAVLHSLVNQAFPEEGLGVGEAEYFVPLEEGSQEEIVASCARLAKQGWSGEKVATYIVNDNARIRAGVSLGNIDQDMVDGRIAKLADFLAQYYPGNQSSDRRRKVSY